MPSKLQSITQLYKDTLKDISNSSENWASFLITASNNYKYSFDEQILIFAQKPDAIACADIDTWNAKVKRWVNKGAKGIALLDEVSGYNKLRYVFDVSDTHNYRGTKLNLWKVDKKYDEEIIETLEANFGDLENKIDLAEAIISASYNSVEDNLQDYLDSLISSKNNSFLEELDDFNIEVKFRSILSNSVAYMTMQRCGINPFDYFSLDDFREIIDFNTIDTLAYLGTATSDIAEKSLREIHKTIKDLQLKERNKNRTFADKENLDDTIINKGNERSVSYESRIQSNRRLPNTEFNSGGNERESNSGQILSDEIKLSERKQKRFIYGFKNEKRTFKTSIRYTNRGNKEGRNNYEGNVGKREYNRGIEKTGSNEMGSNNEQFETFSRGDSDSGTDLQLNFFLDSYVQLPSVDEQINNIQAQAEVENTPAFSFTQEMIDKAIQGGTGTSGGKFRIYKVYQELHTKKERIDFIKKEFNYFGTNGTRGLDGIWVEYSPGKGLTLSKSYSDAKKVINWATLDKRIDELIKIDRYFVDNEKQEYQEWLNHNYESEKWMFDRVFNDNSNEIIEEQSTKNIEKNYKLSNGSYFHFHTNEDGYYYAIYNNFGTEIDGGLLEYSEIDNNKQSILDIRKRLAEFTDIEELTNEKLREVSQEFINNLELSEEFEIGQTIYLEGDRKYRVEAINKELDKIILLDLTMLENAHYPMTREESYLRAIALFKENNKNFENVEKEEIIPQVNKENSIQEKIDYHIDSNNLGEGTPKEKVRRNIVAIKVLRKLEDENRLANKEEQKILSQYIGWGGLPDVFDENKVNWTEEYKEIKELLTDEEYKSARASTLTAFYTPPIVISAIYKALQNMGLEQANILEPSCGTGNFLGMLPQELSSSKLYGVEIDNISGKIAQQLYQNADIKIQGYEKVTLSDSFFDIALGNVPFGDFKVNDKRYDKNNFLIHDYFFAKTLDKVRPGGIVCFITSKGTMDKENPSVRKYIAQRAELLGAIRLPNNTFTKNAGTKVTSDILFLQKRENIIDIEPDWIYLDTDANGIKMNKYFADNPEMILGNMEIESTQYGFDSTCIANNDTSLENQLNDAISNIHGEIIDYEIDDIEDDNKFIMATPDVRNYSYTIVDGKVYYRENSKMIQQDIPITTANRIKGMIELRECTRNLIEMQTEDFPDEDIKSEQIKLNNLYDNFVKKYGLINSRGNNQAFSEDSSYFLLCSLEILDSDGKFLRKADMFTKRTIKPYKEIKNVSTSSEALIVSLSEKARVDMEYMESLTGKSEKELVKELEGQIFENPNRKIGESKYVTADEYLSGNVREKLELASKLVNEFPEFQINIDSLEKVMPEEIKASEIGIKLGAVWIPEDTIRDFIFELLDTPFYATRNMKVRYSEFNAEWYIENKNMDRGNIKAYKTYGTDRINAYKIIETTLNLKDVKIFDNVIDVDGKKTRVLNKKETAIAQAKQEQIKKAFEDWVWNDPDRRNMLVQIYNERFNSIRPREYDGSNLRFVGMNPEISLRKHQLNAIAHVLYGGNCLLAHEVGAGKTFEMVASAMESKRLGLCNKSLFVVPNHIIEQFASEFLQLYPAANILVATKKDFQTANRKKFCSRIATGDYDAVIIGHSQFEKIPMSIERQKEMLEKQISDILIGIDDVKRDNGENFTIKQLEKSRKELENKLEKLNNQDRKDDVITFEELGIDKLFIDEAHNYKNLFLYTKMRNVGGIAQTEAQKSSDLYMKCRYLDQITGGRGTVFATGTPVSNSMVELYTMQRYLQYGTLKKMQLDFFDSWASTFGETVTSIELSPEGTGYRSKTRFAKFHNLPELMNMFKETADIQTAETLNLPTPNVNNKSIVTKPSQIQKDMVQELGNRAERIRNRMVDSSQDNMLKITNEGRKLALDQRLMNNMLEDDSNSKVNECCKNIYDIWERTKERKSTQLVFCDLSTPKQFEETIDENGNYIFTDVYNDIRRKLSLKGMPKEEIAFIHEADNEIKKKELFNKVKKRRS